MVMSCTARSVSSGSRRFRCMTVPKIEPCSSCRIPTRMRSKLDPSRPLCAQCQAGRLKTDPLHGLPKRPGPAKPEQCRICLATDVPLYNGICCNQLACEKRQPPLEGL